jgi:hypothetical protein
MNTTPFEESVTSKATNEQAKLSERNEIAISDCKGNEIAISDCKGNGNCGK